MVQGMDVNHSELLLAEQAEDGSGIIIRIFEQENRRNFISVKLQYKPLHVMECDLMEHELHQVPLTKEGFDFYIKPFEIKTYKLCYGNQ